MINSTESKIIMVKQQEILNSSVDCYLIKDKGEKGLLVRRMEISSVQFSHSVVSDSLRPHGLQHARPLSIAESQSLLRLMSIESVMPSNQLILCHPLLLLPSIFPSIRVFSDESFLRIR